ncbi:MAG: hypothetical protein ACI9ON_000116 [Limisphaerales bacterium]|jgi:hypothetical protein
MQQASQKTSRKEEAPRTWFRSERVYLLADNAWYFRTREGVEIGPYESQFEAEIEAGLLKELIKGIDDEDQIVELIREFVLDSFAMGQTLSPLFQEDGVMAAKG